MLIGKRGSSNDAPTEMAFGSLAIYERVLDDAQIAKAYLAGTVRFGFETFWITKLKTFEQTLS